MCCHSDPDPHHRQPPPLYPRLQKESQIQQGARGGSRYENREREAGTEWGGIAISFIPLLILLFLNRNISVK